MLHSELSTSVYQANMMDIKPKLANKSNFPGIFDETET